MDMSFNFGAADETSELAAKAPEWGRDLDFLWLIAELHAELSEKRLQLNR